jgi:hypothetical protein
VGNQFVIDQAITVLRIGVTLKTPIGANCPAAVFRFTDGTTGPDLVVSPGQSWIDTGVIQVPYAAGAKLRALLRTGSSCASNVGADANLLVGTPLRLSPTAAAADGSARATTPPSPA